MKRLVFLAGMTGVLAGCGVMPGGLFGNRDAQPPREAPAEEVAPSAVPDDARTVDEFDTTSADERVAALDAARSTGGEANLGVTVASLGDVAQQGIWLKTPLVSEPSKGRVEVVATGKAVAVDLIPLEAAAGAGSRISLAAMRLLEVDLTSLTEMRVYRSN
ncbi:MAG: hypothetical protein AAFZ04_12240 [Pseudomonadota bacterium]